MIYLPSCAFFGHSSVVGDIRAKLKDTIIDLIENKHVADFYVGNNGGFDTMVYKVLKEIQEVYPKIKVSVVLAYITNKKDEYQYYMDKETIVPDVIEKGLVRFAISRRNTWMVENSEYVITHVVHSWGGAAQYKALAEKKKKTVINIT